MNYKVTQGPTGGLVKSWTNGVEFEEEAKKQVLNISQMPFIYKHVAVMPDVHAGIGATVGSVIPTRGAIIPAAVGVDIGCGMMAIKTKLVASDLGDNLSGLRTDIELAVPHGEGFHSMPPPLVALNWGKQFARYEAIVAKHPVIAHKRAENQVGTLGGGNHFVEVCLDQGGRCRNCGGCGGVFTSLAKTEFCHECKGTGKTDQNVWVMLHSGSRGVGNRVGSYFIERAREDMRRFFINLPDKDLAYIPEGSELFTDYIEALDWAQNYAKVNRDVMMVNTLKALAARYPKMGPAPVSIQDLDQYEVAVNCHHNYVAREHHFGENVLVTRKGAVRARKGELGIIPGSMGAKSFIVRGLGNPESFDSCSHGAGRRMSRTQAKKQFTVADHIEATEGVECRKDEGVVDETPMAYKSIDQVMDAQKDLVEVVHTLKQVLCVKG